MNETATVRWAGREVTVEMQQDARWGDHDGIVEPGLVIRRHRSGSWAAWLDVPDHLVRAHEGVEVGGDGATSQEALDSVAEQLRKIAAWANGLLG